MHQKITNKKNMMNKIRDIYCSLNCRKGLVLVNSNCYQFCSLNCRKALWCATVVMFIAIDSKNFFYNFLILVIDKFVVAVIIVVSITTTRHDNLLMVSKES